jgi:hypothetical protein
MLSIEMSCYLHFYNILPSKFGHKPKKNHEAQFPTIPMSKDKIKKENERKKRV